MKIADALAHLNTEPRMAALIRSVEMPVFNPSKRVYYDLLDSIVSQQLSIKAATTIFNRVLTLFPDQYPHPELLLEIPSDQLRAAGLSNQKTTYLQNVATFALQHNMETLAWDDMSDEHIIEFLTSIKGVGKWTVQMVLMFTLGRPDIFPVDDLGIQQAMTRLYGLEEEGKKLKHRMVELAKPWQPYRTVASRYLWRWKDQKVELLTQ
jgi:DNA-3-methyladenine glycosylase II